MSENIAKTPKKPPSKAKKIYNIVSTAVVLVIFVLLVAVIGVVMYQRKHNGDAKLFGYYMFNVISDSMEPTIDVGEVILAKEPSDVNALEVGDIITFVAPSGQFKGYNITHRIVEVVENDDGTVKYFKTKGDNPSVDVDEWQLSPSAVKAKYVRVSKFISGFRKFISKWYGYVVLIVIPLVVVGILVVVGYVRDKVEEAREEQAAKVTADDLTDEQKRKLLEDYLAGEAQKSGESEAGAPSSGLRSDGDNTPADGENAPAGGERSEPKSPVDDGD